MIELDMLDATTLTLVKDIATIVGIVIAGGWAAWRWSFGERLRQRREMAAPDGGVSVTEVMTKDPLTVVTVHATWRNRGTVPILLCSEHTRTEVFELAAELSIGPIDLHDPQKACPVVSIDPWWKTYVMEPQTESVMQEHIALKRGSVYAFRHVLCLAPGSLPYKSTDAHFVCIRDLIYPLNDLTERREPTGASEILPPLSVTGRRHMESSDAGKSIGTSQGASS